MALNGKYVNLEYIIEKVRMDYGFDDMVKTDEAAEWAWEGLTLIGAPQYLILKVTDGEGDNDDPLVVNDYKTKLPVDMYSLIYVKDSDSNLPLMYSDHSKWIDEDYVVPNEYQYTYTIRNNNIYTDMEEGNLFLMYNAFPLSDNGLPKIPDDIKYIKAISSYIAERIAFRMHIRDQITERKYRMIEQEWLWYVGAAKTKALMPSIDEMEAMKNRDQNLINRGDHHKTLFKNFHKDFDTNI